MMGWGWLKWKLMCIYHDELFKIEQAAKPGELPPMVVKWNYNVPT